MTTFKQQIFVATDAVSFPKSGFDFACQLANAYTKDVCLIYIPVSKKYDTEAVEKVLKSWTEQYSLPADSAVCLKYHILTQERDFTDFIEETEASMLVFQRQQNGFYSKTSKMLQLCRGLRIPYFFVSDGQKLSFEKVLVPVGFLMEEREKGPMSSSLGRFFGSEILLMTAKDYGSKAKNNADSIRTLLSKSEIKCIDVTATKDSFKVELEAVKVADSLGATLLMISASRDYGLDDIIFGPKEQKVIEQSPVPVMVINPRGDLYALCG